MLARSTNIPIHFGKYYLHRLPLWLPSPFPKYDDTSKELLILFVLFTDEKHLDIHSGIHLISALYSKQSVLKNTDAIAKNIAVKLYIQDVWYHEIKDYLKEQGIRRSDCILFKMPEDEPSDTFNKNLPLTAACLYPMTDKRLSKYKRVMIFDADMFVCRTEFAGEKRFQLLDLAEKVPEDKIGVMFTSYKPHDKIPPHWLAKMNDNDEQKWFEVVNSILPEPQTFTPAMKAKLLSNNGVLYIYSPQTWLKDREFQTFFKKAIPKLRSDEAVTSVYGQHHPDIFMGLKEAVNYGFGDAHLYYAREQQLPYYFHHVGDPTEPYWRHLIGAADGTYPKDLYHDA